MTTSYSTYEAKAKLSEILRRVRAGETVRITYYGEEIAEVRPIESEASEEETIERLQRQGLLGAAERGSGAWEPLAKRPGALRRFLEERE
jgi:prevent-host-death family protein